MGTGSSSGNEKAGIDLTKYYDEVYFNSNSEDEDKAVQAIKKKITETRPRLMHKEVIMVLDYRSHACQQQQPVLE